MDIVVRTAADRAADAIEAAEMMFAEEMGATLDLTPAPKAALTALREARERLKWLR